MKASVLATIMILVAELAPLSTENSKDELMKVVLYLPTFAMPAPIPPYKTPLWDWIR